MSLNLDLIIQVAVNNDIELTEEQINAIYDRRDEIEEYEISDSDYDQMLDEMHEGGYVVVCGMKFTPSTIMKELDPIAYRCGKSDFEGTSGYSHTFDGDNFQTYEDALFALIENEVG